METRAVRARSQKLLYRATERARSEAVDDADLGEPEAHGAVEERGERVDALPHALADQVDLAALVVRFDRTRDRHGDALAARLLADDAELREADLEPQAAALD